MATPGLSERTDETVPDGDISTSVTGESLLPGVGAPYFDVYRHSQSSPQSLFIMVMSCLEPSCAVA